VVHGAVTGDSEFMGPPTRTTAVDLPIHELDSGGREAVHLTEVLAAALPPGNQDARSS
jgi:hypothetical protein